MFGLRRVDQYQLEQSFADPGLLAMCPSTGCALCANASRTANEPNLELLQLLDKVDRRPAAGYQVFHGLAALSIEARVYEELTHLEPFLWNK